MTLRIFILLTTALCIAISGFLGRHDAFWAGFAWGFAARIVLGFIYQIWGKPRAERAQ